MRDRKALDRLRDQVALRARYRCEYCLFPDSESITAHHIDHIVSIKHGGDSALDNLAYTCAFCNWHKGSDVAAISSSGIAIPLFNPRRQLWAEHFLVQGAIIRSSTPEGEVTVRLLRINDVNRVLERSLLQQVGRYPRGT